MISILRCSFLDRLYREKHRVMSYIPNANDFDTEWFCSRHNIHGHRAILYIPNANDFNTEWFRSRRTIQGPRAISYIPNANDVHTEWFCPRQTTRTSCYIINTQLQLLSYWVVPFSTAYSETSCYIKYTLR